MDRERPDKNSRCYFFMNFFLYKKKKKNTTYIFKSTDGYYNIFYNREKLINY